MRTSSQTKSFQEVPLATKHWIALTIRDIEKTAPLDDESAMRAAGREVSDIESRVLRRAHLLAQRLNLLDVIATWNGSKSTYLWLVFGFLLVIFSGLHLTHLMVSNTINPIFAVIGTLALPTILLTIWTVSLFMPGSTPSFFELPFMQRVVCWLLKLTTPINKHIPNLYYGGVAYLRQNRLTSLYFGMVSHGLWTAAFLMLLVITWICHSFISYDIVWQSTLKSPEAYIGAVQALGYLPERLGFPQIGSVTLNEVTEGEARALASRWIIGCIITFGLIPRIILFVFCWLALRFRKSTLAIDFADPYFRTLSTRFSGMEPTPVVDVETLPLPMAQISPRALGITGSAMACIGYELPDEADWPPAFIASHVHLLKAIAGGATESREALGDLATLNPAHLLVICDAGASPDRGTERFLREAQTTCGTLALYVAPPKDEGRKNPDRWVRWASGLKPNAILVLTNEAEAKAWWERALA